MLKANIRKKRAKVRVTHPGPPTISTFILSFFSKLLPCMPCLRADIDEHEEAASISLSDPVWSHPIFGTRPPDTMPVIAVLDNLEAIKPEQINDPWDFFRELETLKKIEEDYIERVKAKTRAAIDRARQRDEELNARLQSKMPKRVSPPAGTVVLPPSNPTGEYVILKIDPVASLPGLDDPKATEAGKALLLKKYVACITWIVPPLYSAEYIPVSFTLVSSGIGDGVRTKFLLPEVTIPIHPNTSRPLLPQRIFPGIIAASPRSWAAKYAARTPTLQMLSSEDGNWRRRCSPFSDAQTAKRSSKDEDKDNDDSTNVPQSADTETDVHISLPKRSVISQLWRALLGRVIGLFDCVTDSASIFSNDASSIYSEDEGGMYIFGPPPSDTMPVAVFSDDLTSLPAEEISDPLVFYDELKELKRIEEEHHERIKRAVEKTRELDDALYDKLMSKARASSPVAESISSGMHT
ncbi:hypothetical protein F5146DRAFT_1145141 [Armillaria mellea]|nr:hypothetical protein F5146DRAFT_1145141 [Armillaria mellea]